MREHFAQNTMGAQDEITKTIDARGQVCPIPLAKTKQAVDGLDDGDRFQVGTVTVEVIHTPGHSPGSVTYDVDGEALLTGDTLFHESVGRVELGATVGLEDAAVEENAELLHESLQRVRDLPGDPVILPSHDSGSPFPPVVARLQALAERNRDLGLDRSSFVSRVVGSAADLPPNVRRIKRVNVGLETVDDADRSSLELGPNRCAVE